MQQATFRTPGPIEPFTWLFNSFWRLYWSCLLNKPLYVICYFFSSYLSTKRKQLNKQLEHVLQRIRERVIEQEPPRDLSIIGAKQTNSCIWVTSCFINDNGTLLLFNESRLGMRGTFHFANGLDTDFRLSFLTCIQCFKIIFLLIPVLQISVFTGIHIFIFNEEFTKKYHCWICP